MKCTEVYVSFNLNYVAEEGDLTPPPNPDPPVVPKRENFNSEAEYQAALGNYNYADSQYRAQWGSTPPSAPSPPPKASDYTNQAQFTQDYAAWQAQNQNKTQDEWGSKTKQWEKNKQAAKKEMFFVERVDQFKNEIFDLDARTKREVGTKYNSSLDFHFDDESGMFSTEPAKEQTDRQRECTDSNGGRNGKLVGIGPNCSDGDKGEGEYHDCFFIESSDCWAVYQTCATDLGAVTTISGKYTSVSSLPIARANNIDMCKDRLKTCMLRAKKMCACEDCMYDTCMYGCDNMVPLSTTLTQTGGTDTNKDSTTPANTVTPGIDHLGFTSSAYYIPQPVIYGRYIVSGNIIWAGDIVSKAVSETTTENNGTEVKHVTTTSTQVHGAFAVGVGAGPLTGILRVWLGDTLLFNKLLETDAGGSVVPSADGIILDEIENTILFSNNTSDKKFYDASKMRLTFFNGDEDQVAPASMGDGAPGYRGLSYVLFENFNLSYVGGRLPEIRVEVVSAQEEVVPKLATAADIGLSATSWVVDKVASIIYAGDGTVIHRYSYDTLEHIDAIDPPLGGDGAALNTLTIIPDGLAMLQEKDITDSYSAMPIYVLDPDSKNKLAVGGYPITDSLPSLFSSRYPLIVPKLSNGNFSIGYSGYRIVSGAVVDAYYNVIVDKNGYGVITSYDPPTRELSIPALSIRPYEASGTSPEVFGTSIIRENYTVANPAWPEGRPLIRDNLFIFSLNVGASQPELMIVKAPLLDTGVTYGAYAPNSVASSYRTQLSIPAKAWGGVSDGLTGVYAIDDVLRDSVVLFIKASSGNDVIMSVKAPNMTVNWAVNYRGVPTTRSYMDNTPSDSYAFIDTHGKVVTLSLRDGNITSGDVLAEMGLDANDGAQYYDPLRATITYAHGGGLRRLYTSRALGAVVSLGALFADLCKRVGILGVDVSAIETISVDGYIVTGGTKPRDALLQLMKIYGVVAYEDGSNIVFHPKQETPIIATLDSNSIGGLGYQITLTDTFKQPSSLKFSYADINNFCKPTAQTVQQAIRRAAIALDDIVAETYAAPIVFADATAAQAATERMFAASILALNTAAVTVSARQLHVTVGDRVTLNLPDGTTRVNRVDGIILTPSSMQATLTLSEDLGYLNDYLPVVLGAARDTSTQTTFDRYVNMRPRAFFLPAMNPADQFRAGTDSAVFYVGVHKNSARAFTPTRIDYTLLNLDTYFTTGATVTSELVAGATVSASLLEPNISPGVPDYESVLIVRFDRPVTITTGSTPIEELIGTGSKNLMVVGKELVQYANAFVDGDGYTVMFDGFVRGRFGTEIQGDFHGLDEEVILVVPGSLAPIYVPLARAVQRSPVALKLASWTAVDQLRRVSIFPWDDVSFQPYAPTHLNRFDAPNGDILLTWNRRSIFNGEMIDASDTVPLSPDRATYNDYVSTLPSNVPYPYEDLSLVFVGQFRYGTLLDVDRRIQEAIRTGGGSGFLMRALVRGDASYIKRSTLASFGLSSSSNLFVAVVHLGGPAMRTPGKPAVAYYPAGSVFPPIPPQFSVATKQAAGYAVISPGRVTLQAANRYIVLRPVT